MSWGMVQFSFAAVASKCKLLSSAILRLFWGGGVLPTLDFRIVVESRWSLQREGKVLPRRR